MGVFKKIARFAKKTTKRIGKRYGTSVGRRGIRVTKGGVRKVSSDSARIGKLAAQMAVVMDKLNSEKKSKELLVQQGFIGQTNANLAGYFISDLTPTWTQGITETTRIGNSLKLTGMHMNIQFQGMIDCYSNRVVKMQLIKTTDMVSSFTAIIQDMYDVNPLTGLHDFHSNYDYSDNKRVHKVLRTKRIFLKSPTTFDTNSRSKITKQMTFGLKMAEVLRFENDAATVPNDYRLFVVFFLDTGNSSPSAASTNAGNMNPAASSGVETQYHTKFWYVDN